MIGVHADRIIWNIGEKNTVRLPSADYLYQIKLFSEDNQNSWKEEKKEKKNLWRYLRATKAARICGHKIRGRKEGQRAPCQAPLLFQGICKFGAAERLRSWAKILAKQRAGKTRTGIWSLSRLFPRCEGKLETDQFLKTGTQLQMYSISKWRQNKTR